MISAVNFAEEFRSKTSALTLITTLGYQFGSNKPLICEKLFMVNEE